MSRKTILVVFGTRPEAIKMAPLIRELSAFPEQFKLVVCVTAQHREMLDWVLESFEITADFDLDVMATNQTLESLTARVMEGVRDVIAKVQPAVTVVHGDTTTTFAASLASFYAGVPVAHVEAGLRTGNLRSPFPEEFNRRSVGILSDLHFAPTETAKENLLREGANAANIFVTGNTVIDALRTRLDSIENSEILKSQIHGELQNLLGFDIVETEFILVTGHRRENHGEGLKNLCGALLELANKYPQKHIVWPLHLNPKVKAPVERELSNQRNICLISPLDYDPFLILMKNCLLLLTDSGGIQEEAPSLNKPVLVTRQFTERAEAVDSGTVTIIGSEQSRIFNAVDKVVKRIEEEGYGPPIDNPYGNGFAAGRIRRHLSEWLDEI